MTTASSGVRLPLWSPAGQPARTLAKAGIRGTFVNRGGSKRNRAVAWDHIARCNGAGNTAYHYP